MRRKVIPELLDDDAGTPAQIAASLADLRHINEWFGGTRTTASLLRRVAAETRASQLSVLEVGSGAGDVPQEARMRLAGSGVETRVTLLDRMWSHLPSNGATSVCGDALQLPFRDGSFDVVSSSLFVHHLEPDALRRFASEALRVCRRAVLMNDLIRSRVHLAFVYAGLPLFRSRLTWHDAPASVRRAYTLAEMEQMMQAVPGCHVEISRHYLYRMGVLLWKEESD
jgi:SAM-dependent methyltransferase